MAALSVAAAGQPAPAARVVLRWKAVAQAAEYELEIAKDKDFREVVVRERTRVTGYRWSELPATTYFWRVRSIDAAGRLGDWSEVKSIETAVAPPVLVRPAAGATLPYSMVASGVEVSIEPSRVLREYVVELSPAEKFEHVTSSQRSPAPRFRVPIPGPGSWWLRVRGVDLEGRDTPPSDARAFHVELPALGSQVAEGKFTWDRPPPPVTLRWSPGPGATGYEVALTQPDGSTQTLQASSPSVQLVPKMPGTYEWKVRAGAAGAYGAWCAPQSFAVELAPADLVSPADRAEVGMRGSAASVELAWREVPGAAAYVVELARDGEFASIAAAQKLEGTTWRATSMGPGEYYWRVRAEGAAADTSSTSPASSFRVVELPPLDLPALLAPAAGTVVRRAEASPHLELRWSPVQGALSYEVALSPLAALAEEPPRTSSEPGLAVDGLSAGDYTWRVRAVDAAGNPGGWSERARFFFGLPITVRAEIHAEQELIADGISRGPVEIRLFDAEGRLVRGTLPEIVATTGTVDGPTEGDDGVYRARFIAPAGVPDMRAAWLIVRDRSFEKTSRISLRPTPGRLGLGVGLGWATTFGAISSPAVGVSASWRTRWLSDRVRILARASGYYGSARVPNPPVSAELQVLNLAGLLLYEVPFPGFSVHAGLGPAIQLVRVSVGQVKGPAAVPGLDLALGVGRPLGPGGILAGVSYTFGALDDPDLGARVRTGGLEIMVGYEVKLQ